MISNYIIHIGNDIINKRIRIKELLNKYERKILEKNVNAFFYILINLIFNLPIERFRLVINRKYIFLKKKKKYDIIFNITKKLLILNNIDIKKELNNYIENKKYCIDTNHEINEALSSCACSFFYNEMNLKRCANPTSTTLIDNIYKKENNGNRKHNLLINEKKDMSPYNMLSNIIINNPDKLYDNKKLFYENYIFENAKGSSSSSSSSNYLNYCENIKNDFNIKEKKKHFFSFNSFYFKEIKNKINEIKLKSNDEYYKNISISCENKIDTTSRTINMCNTCNACNARNACDKKNIILINQKENKSSNINIFDEFLDIYLLFRLRGGKGGFDNIIETTENLIKKKKQEQKLIDKLNNNSSLLISNNSSYDNNDEKCLSNYIFKDESREEEISPNYLIINNRQTNILRDIVANGINQEKNMKKIKTKKDIEKNAKKEKKAKNVNLKAIEDMYGQL
ncbi:SDE2 domain-containing protein [Plasmodium brasilianum]|uniref:SDE2 domain-containing protein n=1 Tax=Plasmodium brasilianum TaxID=5824 RepID=A0ACB9Y861_PLABR|nr:SDE2 domain-containing protein [Plasmodium brasilianum]